MENIYFGKPNKNHIEDMVAESPKVGLAEPRMALPAVKVLTFTHRVEGGYTALLKGRYPMR